MKNGLLICSGTGKYKNIGDYIQSLAAELFFDHIDILVERERLNEYISEEKTKVILNGWFMWNPLNWPPSKNILPFFISFHIVPEIADKMLSMSGIEYLKKYSPIGCRDLNTMKILQKAGIPCYFSGCLTLALGERYLSKKRNGKIIFVDPYYESGLQKKTLYNIRLLWKNLIAVIKYRKEIKLISQSNFICEFRSAVSLLSKKVDRYWQIAAFYMAYKNIFTDDVLLNAEYLTHNVLQANFKSDEEKLDYARRLLNKYAQAQLVITSRIHCALPCLGVETPVLFVSSDNLESSKNPIRSRGRFGGLMQLFHTLRYTISGVVSTDEYIKDILKKGKISRNINIENKPDYKVLRDEMISRCKDFVRK